jgi:lipid II:glycine glycyltransferase (peptidoglycan interpeptide bridge formation enzyme)
MKDTYVITEINSRDEFERLSEVFDYDFNLPLTQSFWYGDLQEKMGRKVLRVAISKDGKNLGVAQIILYPFWRKYKYAYAPYGPVMFEKDISITNELSNFVKEYFRDENIVCFRLESDTKVTPLRKTPDVFTHGGFVQPRYEWEVPLEETDEDLFSSYHKQTRKNIRNGERKGVTVKIIEENLEEHFSVLLKILKDTADRKEFSLHNGEYYKEMVKILDREKKGFLALAYSSDGRVLSGSLHAIVGSTAHGIFGGSINEMRDLYGPFILKFYAMKYARQRGCKSFSIGGIIPPGQERKYKSWLGFTHFKQSFGGRYVVHGEIVDVVYERIPYTIFLFLKRLKSLIFHQK